MACGNVDAAGGKVELMICHDLPSSQGVVGQADFLLGEETRDRIRRVAEHASVPLLLAGHWHRPSTGRSTGGVRSSCRQT